MDSFDKTIVDSHEYIFDTCRKISVLIQKNNETEARNTLIKLLDYHYRNELDYNPFVNHLIRKLGLYPYLRVNTSDWQDRLIYEAFKVDVGLKFPVTLHREQSLVLKKLINGTDLAISAPTSFGKSFIIDAFISIKKPTNVMIIVPTISLTDETRRRLHRKFSAEYK
ncbi:DEAD/DEAH box helicase, partial [Erwinia amylovora]